MSRKESDHCSVSRSVVYHSKKMVGVVRMLFLLLLGFTAIQTSAAAALVYQAAGAAVSGTGAVTPAWPTHVSGDVALLIVESANQSISLSTSAGFVQVANSPQGTGTAGGTSATRLAVYWKRATTSSESNPTVADSGNHQIARIITFRGVVNSGDPWDVTAGNVTSSESTSVSIPGATTTENNTLVVTIVANATDTTSSRTSGWSNSDLAGLTEYVDNNTSNGNGGGFGVAAGTKNTTGAYGTTTATLATSSVQARMSIALMPADSGYVFTGASIGINLGSNKQPLDANDIAGVDLAEENWNNASGASGSINDVNNDDGTSTTADVNWTVNGGGTWQVSANGTATGDAKLMYGYIDPGSDSRTTTVSLSQIPYGEYNVYVYFGSNNTGARGYITDGTMTYGFTNGANNPGGDGFQSSDYARTTDILDNFPTANYAVFEGLTSASVTVNLEPVDSGGDTWNGIFAVQIVELFPVQAWNPFPANGAAVVSVSADLSWMAGIDATSHDVYFGSSNPPAFQGNQTLTTFEPGTMNTATTYYWRIDEIDGSDTTTGNLWSFTTVTDQAMDPSPANGITDISISADLNWTAGFGATSHDVYFGSSNPPAFQGNQTPTVFEPGTMNTATTYYWRIDEINALGTTTGILWSFTTTDDQAENPLPVNGATVVSVSANLSWTAGLDAISHDVYFGSSNPPAFQGNQTPTVFEPGTMNISTTYYWRIDEINALGTTTGILWNFTTVSDPNLYNVKDYGATGNGTTSDTAAINATIAAAEAGGGGKVYFPTGTFKTGSIIMMDNITLEISEGATLLATNAAEYSPVEPNPWDAYQDWGHSHWESSLIWGIGVNNVTITGTGLINGTAMTCGDPAPYYGDRAISFKDCTGILIENIKIYNAGHFGIITMGCSDVSINYVTIDTGRDGINIDCSDHVDITHCIVNAPWDDAICMKSSYGLGYKRATEYVTIDNCTVMGRATGYLLFPPGNGDEGWHAGRIKFGTESNGGFKNITITNCNFDYCRGFMLATVDGGDIDNIVISNIQMTNLFCAPIFMRLGNRARGPDLPPPGTYRNVTFTDITADFNSNFDGNISSIMSGIPGHNIEDVSFSNVNTIYPGGGSASWANIILGENEAGGPDAFMFGSVTPSYAFYVRHADGIEFYNCDFSFDSNDQRPAFSLIDVNGIEFDNVIAERYYTSGDHIAFDNVHNVNIHDSADFPAVTATYSAINADPDELNAGEPFTVTVNAVSGSSGVCTTNLTADSVYCDTAYKWLNSGVQKAVELPDIILTEAGHYLLEIGTQSTTVDIYPIGDFDLSGSVNIEDFASLAGDWQVETGQLTLPNDPVAWWKLEEGSGITAYDSSGNNNTATLYNMDSSDWVSGYDGGALDFDGANDYLRVADSASISVGASDYTLCAWIYPHTISHRVGVITKTESNAGKEYAFYVASDGRLALEVEYNANDGISTTSDAVVQLGQWQHIMVTFDASTRTPVFYYNFQAVPGGSPIPALPTALNNDLYIGMWGQGYLNDNFDGLIDDVRIYNYVLAPVPAAPADLNRDNIVDLNDMSVLANNWLADIN